MEQQQAYSGRYHGEPCMDPMCAEVAAAVDSWIAVPGHKKGKYAEVGPVEHASPLPGVVPCAPLKIVHVIDDSM